MKKILVVDDDKDILVVVEYILRSNGFDVQIHNSGIGVSAIVSKYQPSLVLLDIFLPGQLGTEICKQLKKLYTHIPVVLFSAHANEKKSLNECNADAFIHKPFDVHGFVRIIKNNVN